MRVEKASRKCCVVNYLHYAFCPCSPKLPNVTHRARRGQARRLPRPIFGRIAGTVGGPHFWQREAAAVDDAEGVGRFEDRRRARGAVGRVKRP